MTTKKDKELAKNKATATGNFHLNKLYKCDSSAFNFASKMFEAFDCVYTYYLYIFMNLCLSFYFLMNHNRMETQIQIQIQIHLPIILQIP